MRKLLFFHVTWCAPCRFCLKHIIEPLMLCYKNQIDIINVQNDFIKAEKMKVDKIPTFIILEQEEEIWRHVGNPDIELVRNLLKGGNIND